MADPRVDHLGGVELGGAHVRLEPLREAHLDALEAAGDDPRIWTWFRFDLSTRAKLEARFAWQVEEIAAGRIAVYAVVLRATGDVVGSTSFLDIDQPNRTVEIGATWYHPRYWGGVVNPESKLLLMRHAFEDWGAGRVWLKTDNENERSKAAILRLGAKPEGVLRWHMVRRDGTRRDSAVFSVIAPEWPDVRARLERRLASA